MKKLKISLLLLVTTISLISNAQVLVNNGGNIVMREGSDLVIVGDYHNLLDGNILNIGDIHITGNWINNATTNNLLNNHYGNIFFFGSEMQQISGSGKTWFHNIHLNNSVELEVETSVSSELIFTNSHFFLNESDLIMEEGSQILAYSDIAYIIAESSGKLKRFVGNNEIIFPVGTSSSYTPLNVINEGEMDLFGVNVFNDVLENGSSGSTLSEINHCVINTWNISEQILGGSNLSVTAFWNSDIEGTAFNRLNCGLGIYSADSWQPQYEITAGGENPYFVSRNEIINCSAIAVGDVLSPMALALNLQVDINVFLEGPFVESDMSNDLNNKDLLPLTQPFNTTPWNYLGDESVSLIPENVVDWVLIELRDSEDASVAFEETSIERKAAFLLNDGSVVDLEGEELLLFEPTTVIYDLYAVIWHRNHLGIISSEPLNYSGGVYSYDFTDDPEKAFSNSYPGQKEISNGIYGMFGGDANADGTINNYDYLDDWVLQSGSKGYLRADFQMDGEVNNKDKNDIWNENFNNTSQVPD